MVTKQIIQYFFAATKEPFPSGASLEKDLQFAQQLVAKYGDQALPNVKLLFKWLPDLKFRGRLRGVGSLVRLPWLVQNALALEARATAPLLAESKPRRPRTPKPRAERPWTEAQLLIAKGMGVDPSQVNWGSF
jgi:hypothetical protein